MPDLFGHHSRLPVGAGNDEKKGPAMTKKKAGHDEAAVRSAIVYSLFSSCKAAGIEPREWLQDILVLTRRLTP